jgi:HK97 gp10 family phage protein
MVKITNSGGPSRRLRGLAGEAMIRKVGSALFAGGQLIQVEAQLSITNGAVSGKGHVPSRPGEPPKNDTGILANNIETVLVAPLKVEVSSNAPYAAALEYGTSKMAERPYMRPAVAKKRKEAVALVRGAVNSVISQTQGA